MLRSCNMKILGVLVACGFILVLAALSFHTRFSLNWLAANQASVIALSSLVVAVFTVLLACGTFALYCATQNLVVGAEQTAKQQLRAYVGISKVFIRRNELGRLWLNVENFGQTPADSVELETTHVHSARNGNPTLERHPFGIIEPEASRPAVVRFDAAIDLPSGYRSDHFLSIKLTYTDAFKNTWQKVAEYALIEEYQREGEDIILYVTPDTSEEKLVKNCRRAAPCRGLAL